jgi:hypothetical protein
MNNVQLLNERLLNAEFVFKSNSKLGRLVRRYGRFSKEKNVLCPRFYTLKSIMGLIKRLLHLGDLFSPEDKHIVICSPELRIALGEKEIHVADIRDKILSQVIFRYRVENKTPKPG